MMHEIRLSDISPYCVIRDLLANLWLIACLALTCALGATVYTQYTHVPTYESSVTYYVSMRDSSNSAYSNLRNANRLAGTLTGVFTDDMMKSVAAGAAGISVRDFSVTAEVLSDTNLLRVRVITDDPNASYRVAMAYTTNQNVISEYIFNNAVLEVLEAPRVSGEDEGAVDYSRLRLMAAAFGALLGTAITVAFTVLRDTVQTEAAVRAKLDAPLFGTLSHERVNKTLKSMLAHRKKSPLITGAGTGFYYNETVKKLCSKLEAANRHRGAQVFLVTSAGAGEGKTTVTCNLALGLAQRGHRVLVIDCDMKKPNVYRQLQLKNNEAADVASCLRGKCGLDDVLARESLTGLFVAGNRHSYNDSSDYIASPAMSEMMAGLRREMDIILIDTPPYTVASDTEALLGYADASLMVVAQDRSYARIINDTLDKLTQTTVLGIVFNDVRGRFSASSGHYSKRYYSRYYDSYGGKESAR